MGQVLSDFIPEKKEPDGLRGMALGTNVRWVDKHGQPLTDRQMKRMGAQKLKGGLHASSVWLLPGNNVVEKRYGQGDQLKRLMDIEIKVLTHLKDCDFVPKLLDVDEENRIIRMTYCGHKVKESLELRKTLHRLLRVLEEKHGVYRRSNVGKRIYQLGTNLNATTDGKRIYIVDFGSEEWRIKDNPGRTAIVKQAAKPLRP